jgi:thiamine biosynthesis lipoprotein
MNPYTAITTIFVILSSLSVSYAQQKDTHTWTCMGTIAEIKVPGADEKSFSNYVAVAKKKVEELERLLSLFRPESDISRLNASAGGNEINVSPVTIEILKLSAKYVEISEGAFNPAVAPLVKLWGFSGGKIPSQLPSDSEINTLMKLTDYKNVFTDTTTARLSVKGMSIDLGGIAKGYAVDICYRTLIEMGAKNLMVNIGGNIRCNGSPRRVHTLFGIDKSSPWNIGVRHPFDGSKILGVLHLTDGYAVATSGNYEKYVKIGNERYCHIIDPQTGRPVKGMAGVTVIAPTAVEADAMSTALFVLGPERGTAVLKKLRNCHAIFIPDRQPLKLLVTPGFMKYFTPLNEFNAFVEEIK